MSQTLRKKSPKETMGNTLGTSLADSKLSSNKNMFVTFWGTRGTLTCPGASTLKYGGNTSCVEISVRDSDNYHKFSLILDAGSGLARYGDQALQRGEREFHIFLSHLHYDHVIGLTRFAPLFRSDCKLRFYTTPKGHKSLRESFRDFFSAPFFPIEYGMLPSLRELKFIEIESDITLEGLKIQTQELNHPQGASAFRVQHIESGASVIYVTDHEHGTEIDQQLKNFCNKGTMLLYDSTFSEISYPNHIGWGHSTAHQGALLASESACKAYGLFHHDAFASDEQLENILLPEAKRVHNFSFLCTEGMTLNVDQLLTSNSIAELSARPPPSPISIHGISRFQKK